MDWTCIATQQMRFVHLLAGVDLTRPFGLNDLGCGYGALRCFIGPDRGPAMDDPVDYLGIDVSPAMVRLARAELARFPASAVRTGTSCGRAADYSVASGIFNVCLDCPRDRWEEEIQATIRDLAEHSRLGTAVNFLAPGAGPAVAGLYRTEPAPWVEFCTRELGAAVSVVAGYGLGEFTLILR